MPNRSNSHKSPARSRRTSSHAQSNGVLGVAEGITHTLEAGTEKAQAALESIKTTAHEMSERATDAKDKVAHFIEVRPLTSVLIAMGIGALAARLFVRR